MRRKPCLFLRLWFSEACGSRPLGHFTSTSPQFSSASDGLVQYGVGPGPIPHAGTSMPIEPCGSSCRLLCTQPVHAGLVQALERSQGVDPFFFFFLGGGGGLQDGSAVAKLQKAAIVGRICEFVARSMLLPMRGNPCVSTRTLSFHGHRIAARRQMPNCTPTMKQNLAEKSHTTRFFPTHLT